MRLWCVVCNKWSAGAWTKSSGGGTSSNPQVLALIPRPAFKGMERTCLHHGSNQNSHPPVLVRKPLGNQFIHHHISSRGVFGINHCKLRNFAVFAIECSFATVDRGSLMVRTHRWSAMIYRSLQAEFMETKYDSHIHRYGASVFGKIVVNISKSINNNNQILRRLQKITNIIRKYTYKLSNLITSMAWT